MTLKYGLQITELTEGHRNWYHSKAWVLFIFAFHSNYGRIFRSFTTFYWSAIVNIDLSCTVFELSDVE